MVAIISKKCVALVVLSLLGITILPGQSYSELATKNSELSSKVESLSESIATLRVKLQTATDDRAEVSAQIVKMEMELFDLNRERSELSERLSTMSDEAVAPAVMKVSESGGGQSAARQISQTTILSGKIPAEDYERLKAAEQAEAECGKVFEEYTAAYGRLRELNSLYNQAKTESEARPFSDEFHPLVDRADSLADELDRRWSQISDAKSYAYSMALELLGDQALMARQEELAYEVAAGMESVECSAQSEPALIYELQKRAQVSFEVALAEALKMAVAADSLRSVAAELAKRPRVEDLSAVVFEKRNFILYEPIKFVTKSPYDKSNPIPMAVEYPEGVIYRIQYGAYKYEQLPTVFRGVVPLSKDRALGFWTYYGGGYETLVEAEQAVALCKRRGFNRPEVVEWRDGVRRNLSRDPRPVGSKYRVVISGAESLPDGFKVAVESGANGAELTKIGADKYVVSPIEGESVAESLIAALRAVSEEFSYEKVKIE